MKILDSDAARSTPMHLPPLPKFSDDLAVCLWTYGWQGAPGEPWMHAQSREFLPRWVLINGPSLPFQVEVLTALPPLGALLHDAAFSRPSIWMTATACTDAALLLPVLVRMGADVNAMDAEGETALLEASRKTGQAGSDLVAALLGLGANLELTRNGLPVQPGRLGSPLIQAAHNNLGSVRLLLEAGADPAPLMNLLERRPQACLPGVAELLAPFVHAAVMERVLPQVSHPAERLKIRL